MPRPLASLLAVVLSTGLFACHHHHEPDSAQAGVDTAPPALVHHEDGTIVTVNMALATTASAAGSTVTPTASPVVPDKPVPVAPTTSLWVLGNRSGTGQLGEIYQVFPDSNVSKVVKTFTGRPWSASTDATALGLAYNQTDGRFYGVMDEVGLTQGMAVLYSFDPTNDTFKVLKTLSKAGVGSTAGLNGTVVEDLPRSGFRRKPLLSPDGKSVILLADEGGRDDRGMLVHVNLDPTSAAYLNETVIYDFFSYEESRNDYCQGLVGSPTELIWARDSAGRTVIYMGRQGEAYERKADRPRPTYPVCSQTVVDGFTLQRKFGRVFMLRPSDAADLSKPWVFGGGDISLDFVGVSPLETRLRRHIFFDEQRQLVRFATETLTDGMLSLYSGNTLTGNFYFSAITGCYATTGLLPLDTRGNGILACSGLNGTNPDFTGRPVNDRPPTLFTHSGSSGDLVYQAALNDWYTAKLVINGATWGEQSRRLYLSGGDSTVDGALKEYGGPARIEELNPSNLFARRPLVTGSVKTTGYGYLGDPAVGGAFSEPINDRYVVWLGTLVANASMTLNKHDRLTGVTTTIALETDAGAHPWGKLLDLGNGRAMGRMENTPPRYSGSDPDQVGGYRGARGWGNFGSQSGLFTIDLKTGQIVSFAAQKGYNFSPELARTDDGQVWGMRFEEIQGFKGGVTEELRKIDPATGTSQIALRNPNEPKYLIAERRHSPEARGNAVYGIWFDSVVLLSNNRGAVNDGLFCVRADNPAVSSVSALFGPTDQSRPTTSAVRVPISGDAHGPVEGPTYSPTHDALYMATSRVGTSAAVTIFEIDKGVAKADLCRQAPVFRRVASAGGTDLPSTKILATKSGLLIYGSVSGKLMKFDPVAGTISVLADLKAAAATRSEVRGFLTEVADGTIGAVVYDFDAKGRNIGRRLAGVSSAGVQLGSHDITPLIGENEPYPGVNRFN